MHRRFVVVLVTLVVAMLGSTGAAQAAAVTNASDSGPGSLRQAVAEAATGETIAVPAGDYALSSEPLFIKKGLTLAGAGAGTTTVRSVGPFRVFTIGPAGMEKIAVTLSGMTIRDGRVFEGEALGGGIGAVNTNLTLRGVTLTGNIADANGELAGENGGGAIGGGAIVLAGSLTIADSKVTGNIAQANGGPGAKGGSAQGGGVVVFLGSLNMETTTISGNVAKANGGQGPSNAAQKAGVAAGGGFLLGSESAASTVLASTISGNTAEAAPGPGGQAGEAAGGATLILTKTPLTLTNTTFAGNVAKNGPGNGAPSFAGGVFVLAQEGGTATFTSTTIAANRLEATTPNSRGGNLVAAGSPNSVVFRNSIVANGVGPAGSENCGVVPEAPALSSQGFNLDSLDQCGFKVAGDLVNKDPLLLPLQSFGGPTETMAPAAGSPIVDWGSAFVQTKDQRGVLRPIDLPTIPGSGAVGADGSDIGAFELQPTSGLTLGKLKSDKKRGTATLTVTVPQPAAGTLTLSGKGLKTQRATIKTTSPLKLKVIAKGGTRKALAKKGKRKVKLSVIYTPTGNTATTKTRAVKLIKKKKKAAKPKNSNE